MRRHRDRRRRVTLAVGLTLVLALPCAALPGAAAGAWRGGVEGGTTIGADGTSTLVRLTLDEDERPLTHRLYGDWVRRGGGDDAYGLGYVPRWWFAPRAYGFAETALRGDGELGIGSEVRALAGVGAGASVAPGISVRAEVGVGAVRTDYDDPCDDVDPRAGGACAGAVDGGAEIAALGALRAGASAELAETVRLSADADLEARSGTSELRLTAVAAVRVPGGSLSVTVRSRRLSRDGLDAVSVNETFVGYSFDF